MKALPQMQRSSTQSRTTSVSALGVNPNPHAAGILLSHSTMLVQYGITSWLYMNKKGFIVNYRAGDVTAVLSAK